MRPKPSRWIEVVSLVVVITYVTCNIQSSFVRLEPLMDDDVLNAPKIQQQQRRQQQQQQNIVTYSSIKSINQTKSTHRSIGNQQVKKQKVFLLPNLNETPRFLHQPEMKHILQDGVQSSSKLQYTNNELDPEAIWVVYPNLVDCQEDFLPKLERRWGHNNTPWKIIVFDMTDRGQDYFLPCMAELVHVFRSNEYVHFATRAQSTETRHLEFLPNVTESTPFHSMGTPNTWDRYLFAKIPFFFNATIRIFNATTNTSITTTVGDYAKTIVPNNDNNRTKEQIQRQEQGIEPYEVNVKLVKGYVQPLRFGIRSDLVRAIVNVTQQKRWQKKDTLMTNEQSVNTTTFGTLPPYWLYRHHGAIHFWNIQPTQQDKDHELRNEVSQALLDLARELNATNDSNANVTTTTTVQRRTTTMTTIHAHEIGSRARQGRRYAQIEYIEAMLSHKIVVISQRDKWEDHYRLMEALASGALVMTDPMHPLPTGLRNQVHLIVYHSIAELKHWVLYYLQPEHENERISIAAAGYELAMSKHRSWHIMERLVLGDWEQFNWGEYAEFSTLALQPPTYDPYDPPL